jgi:Polyketide cyclase / dehydrase and lipid transport
MRPVTVSVDVPQSREDVYAFIDVLANHEPFTNHMLVDWECSGPPRGIGARARMRVNKPGRPDWLELQVIAAEPPRTTTEEAVSAGGRRRTRGTYILEELADGAGTRVSFRFQWLAAPAAERLASPLTRAVIRRGNLRSLRRLAAQLDNRALSPVHNEANAP